jgi:hypothetical protein
MNHRMIDTTRYAPLRRGGKALARLALWVQLGSLMLGLGLFLDQAQGLLSDGQFTWGERRVMGMIALITLGGCGMAGWILAQVLKVLAELLDVLADGAEASWRTGDLIEQHLVPALGRITASLEAGQPRAPVPTPPPRANPRIEALRAELDVARSSGMIGKVIELRDALTQYLKGDSLHALDTELALWICNLVERRTRAGTVNAGLATGIARALDSFGDMPEADPLREALPALRRQARLCPSCGQPLSRHETTCADSQPGRGARPAVADSSNGPSPRREHS